MSGATKRIRALDDLTPDPANVNKGSERGHFQLDWSLTELGAGRSILADADGVVLAGNKTLEVAADHGLPVRVVETDGRELVVVQRTDLRLNGEGKERERARQIAVADNRVSETSYTVDVETLLAHAQTTDLTALYRQDEIDALLASLSPDGGAEGEGDAAEDAPPGASLADRFLIPPFSVLDARQGYWQDRKRAWLALGIQSELGRGDSPGSSARAAPGEKPTYRQISGGNGLLGFSEQARAHYKTAAPGGSLRPATSLGKNGKTQRGDGAGKPIASSLARCFGQDLMRGEHTVGASRLTWVAGDRDEEDLDEASRKILAAQPQSGTSIFDPVLCEIAYRWFSPPTGAILDPFAGGSVRGIVAAKLGRSYTGIDLRAEQIAANEEQARRIVPDALPRWIVGDSRDIDSLAPGDHDLLFSCPPYADLEVYSDDPRDLSTMDYAGFLEAYRRIIAAGIAALRPDRFACFVVGDVRDKRGFYRNFVSDTIAAFQDAGARLYNEAILVTAVGSLPIRVGRQFESGRKLGKTHQNVLVFVKGDPKRAVADCGPVEVSDPADEFGEAVGE